jgi:hypothetical protein
MSGKLCVYSWTWRGHENWHFWLYPLCYCCYSRLSLSPFWLPWLYPGVTAHYPRPLSFSIPWSIMASLIQSWCNCLLSCGLPCLHPRFLILPWCYCLLS